MWEFTVSPKVNEGIIFNAKALFKKDQLVKKVWARLILYNHETNYEVSTHGEVRYYDTKQHVNIHNASRDPRDKGAYLKVNIKVNNKIMPMYVHRLVALTFISIPKKYREKGLSYENLEVNHLDLHKWHNVVNNLEWTTRKENLKHARDNDALLPIMGENSHLATITNKQARKICKLLSEGKGVTETSKRMCVPITIVQHIKKRDCWLDISKDYYFPTKRGKYKIAGTIPKETIHAICRDLEKRAKGEFVSYHTIAKKYHVDKSYIGRIKNRQLQKVISKDYKF